MRVYFFTRFAILTIALSNSSFESVLLDEYALEHIFKLIYNNLIILLSNSSQNILGNL